MINRKLSVSLIVLMLVSVGFGMISSDNAQAAFVQPLTPSPDLPSTFVAYDTAWNEAGTMAVVVGFDSFATPGTNAYAYYTNNDSYWPIDNDGWNQQRLHAVDYFREPVYDWPNVLLVDADWMEDGLISYYQDIFSNCEAYVDTWDVWYGMGQGMYENQGKPTAADMAPYDLVVWIPSRMMDGMIGPGDALNSADSAEIGQYLNGGGNFFLSNSFFSDWFSYGVGTFTYTYLGANGVAMNTDYEWGAFPYAGDAVFGSLGWMSQDWYNYGWSGRYSYTDVLYPGLGQVCFECEDDFAMSDYTGLRYDSGAFKTVYLGFPLETLQVYDAAEIFRLTLEWISLASAGPVDQANEYMGNTGYIDVGTGSPTNNPWAQAFVPTTNWISSVEFFMYQNWASGEFFDIAIYNDNGFNEPDYYGVVLTYGTISSGNIPIGLANAAWTECMFGSGGTSLTPGIPYWIVCTRSGFYDTQSWMVDYDQSYIQGEVKSYYTGIWNSHPFDFLFRTHSRSSGTIKSIDLYPTKDNTIYSEYPSNSNGAGEYLIAGTDWYPHYRRGLMEFDIAGSIPKYSTINSVSLNLYCSYVYDTMGYDVELLPLNVEWGEAGSDAPDLEETGTSAMTGDATWDYAYYMSNPWMSGGDYGPGAGYSWIGNSGTFYLWSDTGMVNNVQTWLDNPSSNHGWILRGDEGPGYTAKFFNSRNNPDSGTWPMLSITYTEPTIIGYRDVFWIAGDTYGPTPPATCYKIVPSEKLKLIPMTGGTYPQFFTLAVDDTGGVLCAGQGIPAMYYYNGSSWSQLYSPEDLTGYYFYGLDFNPNDRRFYATGMDFVFYTDTVPLTSGSAQCYRFNHFPNYGGSLDSQLAWNELYDYGIFGGDTYLVKIWPYGEYSNGTIRYQLIRDNSQEHFIDISWDTDGWNEAGIVGGRSGGRAYWRYYNSNPQLLDGYFGAAGTYFTGAFKPPSSPKWLFIPFAGGSLRVNVEEKDQSSELVVAATFPHIFTLDMWKQSDPSRISVLNTQVEADTTYTFFIECNYTREGIDQWDTALGMYFEGWFDMGNVGAGSAPGDPTWTMDMYRTRQFNISYFPAAGTATVNYPTSLGGVQEFALHSVWEDPVNYGADLSHYRLYINMTFRQQTEMAPGDGMWNPGNSWDQNSLNDPLTWDFKALLYDTGLPEAHNSTFAEFGVQRYAALSVSGNPTGSIPPGSSAILATPSRITYSSNTPYQLNVSIPHLYKDGNIASSYWIPADDVSVMNAQGDDTNANSDIWDWRAFAGPDDAWCIWGLESGTYIPMPGHGTVTAGPVYTDYTAAGIPELFQPTPVYWQVVVPVGTPEGVYRGTITITLWSL